jgi:hypothetical protein
LVEDALTSRALRRGSTQRANRQQGIAQTRLRVASIPAVVVGLALNTTLAVAAAELPIGAARLGTTDLGGIADGGLTCICGALGGIAAARLAQKWAAIAAGARALSAGGALDILLARADSDTQAGVGLALLAGAVASFLAADAVRAGQADLAFCAELARIARLLKAVVSCGDLAWLANAAAVFRANLGLGSAVARAAARCASDVGLANVGCRALSAVAQEAERRQAVAARAWRAAVEAFRGDDRAAFASALRAPVTLDAVAFARDTRRPVGAAELAGGARGGAAERRPLAVDAADPGRTLDSGGAGGSGA